MNKAETKKLGFIFMVHEDDFVDIAGERIMYSILKSAWVTPIFGWAGFALIVGDNMHATVIWRRVDG